MTGLLPLPVVLVSCLGNSGDVDIVTVGMVTGVCSEPPQVGISLRPSRYSHRLISETREFVINIPGAGLLRQADYCGIATGRKERKFEKSGLTPEPAFNVRAPLIRECPVSVECRVMQVLPLGSHDLFIGEVLSVDVDPDVISSEPSDGVLGKDIKIDFGRVAPFVVNFYEYWSLGRKIGRVYGVASDAVAAADSEHRLAVESFLTDEDGSSTR